MKNQFKIINQLKGKNGHIPTYQQVLNEVQWIRASSLFKNKQTIFGNGISPNDIQQGVLGNCYFLSAISGMANYQQSIQKLFIGKEVNPYGVQKEICIDDYFPVNKKNELIFSKSVDNKLWVMILEKAWAKLYGGYSNIEAGLTREVLRDLSGAPSYTVFTNSEKIWEKIQLGLKKKQIMTAGSYGDVQQNSIGLIDNHAYTINNGFEIYINNQNPWGFNQKLLARDEKDSKWIITNQLNDMSKDGNFFICYDDFLKLFDGVQFCNYDENFKYSYLSVDNKIGTYKYFQITINQAGIYYFSISQIPIRHYESITKKYSTVKLIIRKQGVKSQFLTEIPDRDVTTGYQYSDSFKELSYQPGTYYFAVYINEQPNFDGKYGLSAYGPNYCDMIETQDDEIIKLFIETNSNVNSNDQFLDQSKNSNILDFILQNTIQNDNSESSGRDWNNKNFIPFKIINDI